MLSNFELLDITRRLNACLSSNYTAFVLDVQKLFYFYWFFTHMRNGRTDRQI